MSPFDQPSTLSILPLLLLLFLLILPTTQSTTFTLINKCTYTIWPGFLSNAGTPQLSTTGFSLPPTTTTTLSITQSWSGRLWARTLCSTNSTTDQFSCITGDCSTGTIQCSGNGATPPATLAEFTLNGADGLDFYDVSLVDGYNVPMAVVPQGGNNCSATGCVVDLNGSCPLKLRVLSLYGGGSGGDRSVACRSACEAFGSPEYCCSGAYATPESCKPSLYSEFFKKACPTAYSYAYDDGTSTFTCKTGVDYVITFCPTTATLKKTTGQSDQMSPEVSPAPSVMASAGGSLLRSPSLLMFIPLIATFFFTLWSTSTLLLL